MAQLSMILAYLVVLSPLPRMVECVERRNGLAIGRPVLAGLGFRIDGMQTHKQCAHVRA